MDPAALKSIVSQKNQQLEHQAVDEASKLIDELVFEQDLIVKANARIGVIQKKLADLQVTTIDPAILGG